MSVRKPEQLPWNEKEGVRPHLQGKHRRESHRNEGKTGMCSEWERSEGGLSRRGDFLAALTAKSSLETGALQEGGLLEGVPGTRAQRCETRQEVVPLQKLGCKSTGEQSRLFQHPCTYGI